MTAKWSFEADAFTACNCDWGCPCNFNAPPTKGHCTGWGAYRIRRGVFGTTKLDGGAFAVYYTFPGHIEQGNGVTCAYVDSRAPDDQQEAMTAIATGQAGGGIFELFAKQLSREVLPTRKVPIEFGLDEEGRGVLRIGEVGEAESDLLRYPDGTVIRPWLDLPHGIEFKRALMTNAKRWRWRDGPLQMDQAQRYGAWSRVRFDETGCVG